MEKTIIITFYGLYMVNKEQLIFDNEGYLLLENPIDDIINQDQILSTVDIAISSDEQLELFTQSVVEAWKCYRRENKKNYRRSKKRRKHFVVFG